MTSPSFSERPRSVQRIGIAGAGLLGRLAAWSLSRQGHQVCVFDPAEGPEPQFDGQGAAGFTAAGMLSPLAELETTDADVAERGWTSIERWAAISTALRSATAANASARAASTGFQQAGSLLVAHGADLGAARRVLARIALGVQARQWRQAPQALSPSDLQGLEPALHGSAGPLHAWLLPGEGALDTVATLQALHDTANDVQWHWGQRVHDLSAGMMTCAPLDSPAQPSTSAHPQHHTFDWVFDLRGVGAKSATSVRGVRGEVIWLHAPGVALHRPVRLLHPRHRVYIVPRAGDMVLVGASEIESEDRSPVSLRSAVELMAAAHSLVPALAEARILRMDANLRPALPDNRPEVHVEPGLVRINGLYRHGWLLAPALLDEALARAAL